MKVSFFIVALFTLIFFNQTTVVHGATTTGEIATNPNPESVKDRVQDYFSDLPVMSAIAHCESNFRQFTDSGNVLRGGAGNKMIGIFQFYEKVHKNAASNLGYNINTIEGNLDYARHVYERQGTTPWNSSKECWEKKFLKTNKQLTSANPIATKEDLETKIKLLQQILALLQQLKALKLA